MRTYSKLFTILFLTSGLAQASEGQSQERMSFKDGWYQEEGIEQGEQAFFVFHLSKGKCVLIGEVNCDGRCFRYYGDGAPDRSLDFLRWSKKINGEPTWNCGNIGKN